MLLLLNQASKTLCNGLEISGITQIKWLRSLHLIWYFSKVYNYFNVQKKRRFT